MLVMLMLWESYSSCPLSCQNELLDRDLTRIPRKLVVFQRTC
jgi:hypothetical protein